MKNSNKLLTNIIIVTVICFLAFFSLMLYQDYEYYSVYDKSELMEFFSMGQTILHNINVSSFWCCIQMIVTVPLLYFFEKTKIKNITKIVITLTLTFAISFLFVLFNL